MNLKEKIDRENLFKYDLNEYSKRQYERLRKEKVEKQQRLIRNASSKLIYFKNERKEKFIEEMENAKSTFDKQTHVDQRRFQYTQRTKNLVRNTSQPTLRDDNRRIYDYYVMNDNFIKEKNNFLMKNDNLYQNYNVYKRPKNFLDLYSVKKNNENKKTRNVERCKRYDKSFLSVC